MKTIHPKCFLYSNHSIKNDAFAFSPAASIVMTSRQLIFKSTASDVFWILYPQRQRGKQLIRMDEKPYRDQSVTT